MTVWGTRPRHAQTNAMVKRFNRRISETFGRLESERQRTA